MKINLFTSIFCLVLHFFISPQLGLAANSDDQEVVRKTDEVNDAVKMLDTISRDCFHVQAETGPDDDILISDSLVSKLSCSKLTPTNVFRSIDRGSAFSVDRHLPFKNWQGETNILEQCWALALTQREMFYLLRYGAKNGDSTAEARQQIIGNILGTTQKKIVSIGDSTLSESKLIKDLLNENSEEFKRSIERRQAKRFYSLGNLKFVFSGRDRSENENRKTIQSILTSMDEGKMPLLIFKVSTMTQHVVLVRKIEKQKSGEILLFVYDSVFPGKEMLLRYRDGHFYARFDKPSDDPIGIYIEDEDEMDSLQKVNFEYYRDLCVQLKKSLKH